MTAHTHLCPACYEHVACARDCSVFDAPQRADGTYAAAPSMCNACARDPHRDLAEGGRELQRADARLDPKSIVDMELSWLHVEWPDEFLVGKNVPAHVRAVLEKHYPVREHSMLRPGDVCACGQATKVFSLVRAELIAAAFKRLKEGLGACG